MATNKITRLRAEKTLEAVKEQFKVYIEPQTYPAYTDEEGVEHPEVTYPAGPPPVLLEDWDGPGWVISWEEGPEDWAMRVNHGGPSEEDLVLSAAAAKEFGVEYKAPTGPAPAKLPKGVWVEPYNSYTLGLYRA